MADNKTVARPYAQAAFEVARENNAVAALSASLQSAKALFGDDSLESFLASPKLDDEQRLSVLQDLFGRLDGAGSVFAGGSEHGTNFLKLLLENRRAAALPEIADHFEELKAETENKIDVTVASASPLSAAQLDQIATAMKARLGRDVSIETEIDKSLIGGAVITAGDVVIDGSTRARLKGLANALAK